eukprot:CAMPEP_0172502112 /NCGR_PEP_ID=MMETSP1066-20121228/156818_1 /TAXON_ID=671091 /ORGANISM="Coscinodiscus wailesii, Strain CCMP2513" /LENGTH=63 /DNA_ID=CAMNT_0013277247 /DNA_START=72 /DNA_END=260 /DNA_ORIENTATION=+
MSDPVTRALHLANATSRILGTSSTTASGSVTFRSILMSRRHFPKTLGVTMVVSGIAGWQITDW